MALTSYAGLVAALADWLERDTTGVSADDLIGLLTPVIKGYLTDRGFETAVAMQQIYGGHGYIREWGMEQFVRDARIAQIYEGANGIQALDLIGRKLPKDGGRAIQAFMKLVGEEAAAAKGDEKLATQATFAGAGAVQAWDPETGAIRRVENAAASAARGTVRVPLVLEPWSTALLVVGGAAGARAGL